jgi:hypothetical protein
MKRLLYLTMFFANLYGILHTNDFLMTLICSFFATMWFHMICVDMLHRED